MSFDVPQLRRRVDVARLAVATAIFTAALCAWDGAVPADTRVAALAFAGAVAWTAVALVARRWRGRALQSALGAQIVVDLGLATACVHVTGGAASQFAALYVLAITEAAVLLPSDGGGTAGAVLAAGGACALYAAEVLWWRPVVGGPSGGSAVALALQIGVFAAVGVVAGLVGARLRQVRVEAADVLRSMQSGVMTVDAGGHLLFANAAAAGLLGISLDSAGAAAVGGGDALGRVAAVAPALAELIARAARRGERTTRAEVGVVRADGRTATFGVTTTASDGVGGGRTATAVFSDITDTKRVASLHLRAERLEAVAELAASLAHEIRNPLASIRSAVEQLARMSGRAPVDRGEVDDDVRTLTALTVRESDRLSRLLGEFLEFARARVTRLEPVDLAGVADAAARLAAAHPEAARVRVVVHAGDGRDEVHADAELLHQALFNLVLNAAQAARSRVEVAVGASAAAELPAGLAFVHGAVAVRVSDDGPGVAPEVAERLFEPFVTTRAGGSGLGLAVVQRAVDAHGGVVLVGGGPGAGATFTLVLPRALPRALPRPSSPARSQAGGGALGGSYPPYARPYLPTPVVPHPAVA